MDVGPAGKIKQTAFELHEWPPLPLTEVRVKEMFKMFPTPFKFASPSPTYVLFDDQVVHHLFFLSAGIVSSVLFLWLFISRRTVTKARGLSCLPGPRPLPLVGNLHQVNTAEPWLTYTSWRKQYGDLLHVRLLNQSFIILNSEKMARALLDQRSAVYSDRPEFMTRLSGLFGTDISTVMLPYGDEWKLHRKLCHPTFRAESEGRNRDVYLRRVQMLLENLLDAPAKFEPHIKSYVATNVMALAYGYETTSGDDPMVKMVMTTLELLATALSPARGAILAAFPFLTQLPDWFPGTEICRDAAYVRGLVDQVLNVPFNWVKDKIKNGTAPPSLVADCLTDDYSGVEQAIKATAGTLFLAGFETSSSTLHAFILAMVLYPEVQAKAQAEIDAVIGRERLPNFGDRESLPYVDALLRELVRWNPAVPLGIPHATSDDDVIDGCHVPKGTTVLINAWAMSRDEDLYTDPEAFKPERFLSSDGMLQGPPMAASPVFGLGRRACPGRFASETFTWAAIVSILATFRITKARDEDGKEIDVQKKFTTGIAVRPVEFPCWIVPRFDERVRVIRQSA